MYAELLDLQTSKQQITLTTALVMCKTMFQSSAGNNEGATADHPSCKNQLGIFHIYFLHILLLQFGIALISL